MNRAFGSEIYNLSIIFLFFNEINYRKPNNQIADLYLSGEDNLIGSLFVKIRILYLPSFLVTFSLQEILYNLNAYFLFEI